LRVARPDGFKDEVDRCWREKVHTAAWR
jgi:hypothetical protein